jgi:hypothetical protein
MWAGRLPENLYGVEWQVFLTILLVKIVYYLEVLFNNWHNSLAWLWVKIQGLMSWIGSYPYDEKELGQGFFGLGAGFLAIVGSILSLVRLEFSYYSVKL